MTNGASGSRWTAAISPRTFDRALEAADVTGFRPHAAADSEARRAAAWTWVRLPHQGAPAARRTRTSISVSIRTARCPLITGTQTIGQGHENDVSRRSLPTASVSPNASITAPPGRHRPGPRPVAATAARAPTVHGRKRRSGVRPRRFVRKARADCRGCTRGGPESRHRIRRWTTFGVVGNQSFDLAAGRRRGGATRGRHAARHLSRMGRVKHMTYPNGTPCGGGGDRPAIPAS